MNLLELGNQLLNGCRAVHNRYGRFSYQPNYQDSRIYMGYRARLDAEETIWKHLPAGIGYDVDPDPARGVARCVILDGEGDGTGWIVYITSYPANNHRSNHYMVARAELFYNWPDGSLQRFTKRDLKKENGDTAYFKETEVR